MKKFIILFLFGVLLLSSPVLVSAANDDIDIKVMEVSKLNPAVSLDELPKKDIRGLKDVADYVNIKIRDKGIWCGNRKDPRQVSFLRVESKKKSCANVYYNMIEYNLLDKKQKMVVIQVTLDSISSTDILSETTKNKVCNGLSKLDEETAKYAKQLSNNTEKDYEKAWGMFVPFSGLIGSFLGGATIGLFVILSISIVFDLFYIAVPAFHCAVDALNSKHQKQYFVSDEAVKVVKEVESKA